MDRWLLLLAAVVVDYKVLMFYLNVAFKLEKSLMMAIYQKWDDDGMLLAWCNM